MNNDASLLRRYAEEGSETAFSELVHRYVDLVYGAALRRTGGDEHRASDVAQQVFTALARDARKLSGYAVLAAWLHTATRNAALNLMISEQRRKTRELEALALETAATTGGSAPDWDRLRPLLDAAIDELPETDRTAVVLRFLERRAFAEIGSALQVSEDAARMRTDRALDKLRAALARRGITSTSAALGAIMASQPLMSAPVDLAAALASQSLATAGSGLGVVGLFSIMTTKIIITTVLTALVAFGAGAYVGLNRTADIPPPPVESPRQSQLIALLRQDNQALKTEVGRLKADITDLDTVNVALEKKLAAVPPPAAKPKNPNIGGSLGQQQRAVLNNLRQIDAARKQFLIVNGRPPSSILELVGIDRFIKTVRTVNGEDYSELPMTVGQPLTVTAPDGTSVTYDPSGATTTVPQFTPIELRAEELGRRTAPLMKAAIEAYRAANNGNNPPNEQAVLPFFATPQDAADYAEFMKARHAAGL